MDKKVRKDSWTPEDDQVLADTVLGFIQEGKTQMLAFEEAGRILGRSKQACGFRWNKTLRKQYNIRKESRTETTTTTTVATAVTPPSTRPEEIQSYLTKAMTSYKNLAEAYEALKREHEQLQSEHQKIKSWLSNGKELLRIE